MTDPTTAYNPAYTDAKGRTTADRINAIQRGGGPLTPQQRADAMHLLESVLLSIGLHGFTIDDSDWVTDLPGACVDLVLHKAHREGTR
ncbi:hypothetical protein ACFVHI_35530 [Kitasatospora sp. NPDC127121]|uniref:hypothetical protein n=1 Tax=Kitasatospora sp. NPDC127121 TaxID=3345371 RepID=UPI00363B1AD5